MKRFVRAKDARTTGITLIALVVTIVVLLILAGITITYVMGDNSIFQQAFDAKTKTEIAKLRERIEVIQIDWWTDKKIDPTVTLDNFWERLIDDKIIGSKDDIEGPEKEGENDVYLLDTTEGYIVEVIVTPDGNVIIGEIVKGDSLPPKVQSIKVINKTSNSIEVEVTISRLEDGKLSYYYKKESETEYHELADKIKVTDLTAIYAGLEQNQIYNIKVVAENKKGKGEKVINVLTGELETGVISQKGETTWANSKASIELETTNTNLTLKYQIGAIDDDKWLPYNGPIGNLNHDDTVYAVLTDGTNYGEVATVVIRDGTAPIVTVTKGTVTTNSIGVTVAAIDNEWGMPTSPSYSYYIKKKTDANYPTTAAYTGTQISYTFTGLTQNTDYDIKVTTKDKAENEGTGTLLNTKTGTVGGASTDLATGNITASSPTWNSTSHTASVTLSTTTGLQIQWQKNGINGTWTTVPAGQNSVTISSLNHGDNIYARLYDGTNTGSEAYVTIRDGVAPTNATITLGATTANTGANVTATVTHNDAQSGPKIASCKWVYNTTSTKIGTNASSYTGGTFSSNGQKINLNASAPGTYYLHVLTTDNGGNVWETVSNAVTVKQLATGITVSPTTVSLQIGGTQQLTATVTPTNASNKGVTWTSSNANIVTVSSSGLVTAKGAGTATITVKTADGSNKVANCTITVQNPPLTSETMTSDETSWEKMNAIAKAIANDSSITNSSTKATGTTANGDRYEINVGDIYKVKYSGTEVRVRVLGFKHDDLVDTGIYGGSHTKASISFEFYDFITGATFKFMNSTDTNSGGWANTQMRKDLNGYTTNSAAQSGTIGGLGTNLNNKSYIKQVKKKYIPTYHTASTNTCNDYLWLLAASEIVNSGHSSGGYGYAITQEGEQYLYYKNNATEKYSLNSSGRVKKTSESGNAYTWWLRSTGWDDIYFFSMIYSRR